MSSIGIMEGAFFVGRKEIMDWINSTLDLNLTKVEETANGAIACQLLDIMYPNQVPMAKVNWAAKQDFEYVANYKILQTCFTKLSIDKHIDVDRLISGKYMDNLEFMQWFKRFFELAIPEKVADYDAYGQRCKGKGGATYGGGKQRSAPTSAAGPKSVASRPQLVKQPTQKPKSAPTDTTSKPAAGQENSAPNLSRMASTRTADKTASSATAASVVVPQKAANATGRVSNGGVSDELQKQLDESRRQVGDLKVEMEGLEKERDFYFDKLREIEVLLQDLEDKGQGTELSAAIFKILYATAEGFEPVVVDVAAPTATEDVAQPESEPEPSPTREEPSAEIMHEAY